MQTFLVAYQTKFPHEPESAFTTMPHQIKVTVPNIDAVPADFARIFTAVFGDTLNHRIVSAVAVD